MLAILYKNKSIILAIEILIIATLLITSPKIVVIDNNGFKPNSIEIVKGSNVSWVSRGSFYHWPASDAHPTHNKYPSKNVGCIGSNLDSCRELKNNEIYTFTFDEVGAWGIHDHLLHSHTMTIHVYDNYLELLIGKIKLVILELKEIFVKMSLTPKNTILDQVVPSCANHNRTKFIACLKITFEKSINQLGVEKLLSELEVNYKKNDFSSEGGITRCHDIAHAIGQAGVSVTKDPKKVFSQCTNLCTSGCFHGAVEQTVLQEPADAFLRRVDDLCSNPACYHGLGHGLASIAAYDLQKSLHLCDGLNEHESKKNCGFGVFMELYEPSSFNPVPKALPQDLLNFCNSMNGVYLEVCYRNIGTYEYARTNQAITKALETCRLIPKQYQRECRVALGQQIYFNQQGNTAKIINLCKNAEEGEVVDCIDGAIMSSVSSDTLARHGFELCSQVKDTISMGCYKFLGEHIQDVYGEDSRLERCQQVKEDMLIYKQCSGQNSKN